MDGTTGTGTRDIAKAGRNIADGDPSERQGDRDTTRPIGRRLGQLPTFWTISKEEKINVAKALRAPLSGYLGGRTTSGYWCSRLADEWSEIFGCKYSTPCNSATSGLLAACMAADIGEGDIVWVSTYTMSASATCAMMLGAQVRFLDINPDDFTLRLPDGIDSWPKAIIVTNLFGNPAHLHILRSLCEEHNIILIEDNAQAPFAKEEGQYTGTIGHIGVFSLNVHKHIQAGEGGVIVTDDPELAHRIDCAINHGELMRTNPHMGLNLRMTEPIAAIASAQLKRGSHIVQSRINLAHKITALFENVPFVEPPKTRENCDHVFYLWAGKIKGEQAADKRKRFLEGLRSRGVPFREGYSPLLHRLLWSGGERGDESCPVACEMEDQRLFTFEICAYDPNAHHLKLMKRIIEEEANAIQ